VSLDAMTQKMREGGRIVNIAAVIAVGVNAEGIVKCSDSM
jgi:transposase-like protein